MTDVYRGASTPPENKGYISMGRDIFERELERALHSLS